MANIRGMGPCPIPGANNLPCGRQIQEGEPVGSISVGTAYNPQSRVGHKKCADSWWERKRSAERERNFAMVQRINQDGPGGAVDFNQGYDAVKGSIPLERQVPTAQQQPRIEGDMSQGAHFIGDLPEDATPAEAVQYAQGEPIKVKEPSDFSSYKSPGVPLLPTPGPQLVNPNPPSQVQTAYQDYAKQILGDPLPRVDAAAARVVLADLAVRPDGTLHLNPEDTEYLIDLLRVNVKRARRQAL